MRSDLLQGSLGNKTSTRLNGVLLGKYRVFVMSNSRVVVIQCLRSFCDAPVAEALLRFGHR